MACAADGRGARVLERGGARRRADRASVTRRDDVAQRQLRRLHGPQRPTPSHRPSTTPPHRSTFTAWSQPPFPWVTPSDAERDRIHSIPRDGSSLETRSGVRTLPFSWVTRRRRRRLMGRSALHLAVDSESMETVELLLDRVNFECIEESLLHAISMGATKIVKVLTLHLRISALLSHDFVRDFLRWSCLYR